MADMFWDVATSYVVLSVIGLVLVAALVVGYFPLLKWFPLIGTYVPVGKLVSLLMAALLCFLVGFRIADERAEAKSLKDQLAATKTDLSAASEAATKADQARAELAAQAEEDQKRIAEYADALKSRPNAACTLVPDDFDELPNGKRAR